MILRIIFAGTPDFAASHLQALIDAHCDIVGVYTQPDRPSGRGNKLSFSAVKTLAIKYNLPVFQPDSLKNEHAQQALQDLHPDLFVVVAYGLILPKAVLTIPRLGCINVHGSILPKWRGAAPIQRAIWAGDHETGVTIMKMDEGLDTGDILSIHRLPIGSKDTSYSLYNKLAVLGPQALVQSIVSFASLNCIKQNNDHASYAKKLTKEEAYLNWGLPAVQLERNVRAFNPWPVAWFWYQEKPVKVWQAHVEPNATNKAKPGTILSFTKDGLKIACNEGVLTVTTLQLAGKKAQEVSQIINGQPGLFAPKDIIQ